MNTYMPCAQKIVREWYVVDASGLTLGRLATQVAAILRGKNKPTFTPNMDCGDYVIIVNADKIELTGNKWNDKLYRRHSGYNGGVTTSSAKDMMAKFPTRMVEMAVKGMLPHNKIGAQMASKLFVYAGENHPHQAQQPKELKIVNK